MTLLANETLIPLESVQDSLELKDLKKDLHYARVYTPNNAMSDYFTLFYRDEGTTNWNTKNGLLSKEFTIAKTEKVLEDIITNLASSTIYRKDRSFKTFSMIDFTLTNLSVVNERIQRDDLMNTFLFKLITNIDPIAINNSTELSFSIVNAFGGEHTLYLAYGLLTKFVIGSDVKRINNLLVLNQYSSKLIHNASMVIDIGDIVDVKNHIEEKIKKWKAIKIEEDEMKIIEEHFSKKFMKLFNKYYATFPSELNNLFYISYLFSFLIESEKNVNLFNVIATMLRDIELKHKDIKV